MKIKKITWQLRRDFTAIFECNHWEMIKARVFITLFLVWVCFAVWGKYVS